MTATVQPALDGSVPEPSKTRTQRQAEDYVKKAGWACSARPTTHHSGVRTWKGTAAARRAA
ncbi:hypothetical protein ACFWHL_16395 [Streptomyces massasporeus]